MTPGRPRMMEMFYDPEYRAELAKADVIFGLDEETGNRFLVWGRSTLKGIADSGQSMRPKVHTTELLQRTLELEAFIAAVRVAKGRDEYEASPLFKRHANS